VVDVLRFAERNPVLTFLIVLFALQATVYAFRYLAIAVRGWPVKKCKNEESA
jgi:hypothetical protein